MKPLSDRLVRAIHERFDPPVREVSMEYFLLASPLNHAVGHGSVANSLLLGRSLHAKVDTLTHLGQTVLAVELLS